MLLVLMCNFLIHRSIYGHVLYMLFYSSSCLGTSWSVDEGDGDGLVVDVVVVSEVKGVSDDSTLVVAVGFSVVAVLLAFDLVLDDLGGRGIGLR